MGTKKKSPIYLANIVIPLVVFALLLGMVFFGVNDAATHVAEEQFESIKGAVQRAALQCYAIEGMYPVDVAYLEDHYGLLINHDKYNIFYVPYGSNILPDIDVFYKFNPGSDSQAEAEAEIEEIMGL